MRERKLKRIEEKEEKSGALGHPSGHRELTELTDSPTLFYLLRLRVGMDGITGITRNPYNKR
jgi:hypothetical protein